MKKFGALLATFCLLALGACGRSGMMPVTPSQSAGAHLAPMDTATTSPANGSSSLPGNGSSSLPGNGSSSLPGAQLACASPTSGTVSCTVAININIPPVSDLTTPSNLLPGLHPDDLQNAYALPSQNTGGTIAIVDAFDDPNAETDLGVYRAAYGLPACTSSNGCFRKVNQTGAAGSYPALDLGWSEEISIDLDTVSAVCPNCKILLVEANSTTLDDLGAAVNTAANLGAKAISNSYYTTEWSTESSYDHYYNHPGIAITVAAGDAALPFYPAASPYVTAVGGTSLSGSSGSWNETPWTYTGQGCSVYEPKPDWQGNNRCEGKRSTVDVAAVADPQTGVSMYDSTAGGWLVAGGTSVGAPLIAAAYALSGNPQGPAFSYAHRSAFHDIAPAGYDWPTGLGSPNGAGGL